MIKQHLDNGDVDEFLKEMKMIGIELSEEEVDDCFFHPSYYCLILILSTRSMISI